MDPGTFRKEPRKSRGKGAIVVWMVISMLALVAIAAPAGLVQAAGSERPTQVTFRYRAFGAPSPTSVTLANAKGGQSIDKSTVSDGEDFTVQTAQQTTVALTIGGKSINVHTSCSAPIAVGYVFNDAIEKPAPDATTIVGYNGPTAVEIIDMQPVKACGGGTVTNTPTPTPSTTPTPSQTPTCPNGQPMPTPPGSCPTPPPSCPNGQTMPPSGTCATPTPTRTPTPPPDLRCPVGTFRLIVKGTNDANYTDFTFTVSVEYNGGRSLDFTSNLGVRELLVAGSGGVNRYQFNPPIKLGNRFQATGGHTITQVAFCYVKTTPTPTPTRTPTNPPCNCATPTPPPPPTPTPCSCGNNGGSLLVQDFYGRTTSGTWANADKGGPYSLAGSSSSFNVNGGSGAITVNTAGTGRGALLNQVNAQNVDIKFKVRASKVAAGGKYYIYAVARHNGNNEYRPRMIWNADGSVSVHASVLVNGVETSLGTPVKVAGLAQCDCKFIWFRAQVVGSSPTTIRVKAWADGSSEPGWQFTTTNSSAACQTSGSVGLRVYLAASVTNAPVTFRFDNYTVMSL
jgi:hypothetical protein